MFGKSWQDHIMANQGKMDNLLTANRFLKMRIRQIVNAKKNRQAHLGNVDNSSRYVYDYRYPWEEDVIVHYGTISQLFDPIKVIMTREMLAGAPKDFIKKYNRHNINRKESYLCDIFLVTTADSIEEPKID